MDFKPVPNHPECRRWFLGVRGPVEPRHKIIITRERNGKYVYRAKCADESDYWLVGDVATTPNPIESARRWRVVMDLY